MNIKLNSFYTTLGGIIRLVLSLISLPIQVKLLGLETYGIFTVINSIIAIACMFDFGIGIAQTYVVSSNLAKNDSTNAGKTLTSSLYLISVFSIVVSIILLLILKIFSKFLFPTLQNPSEVKKLFIFIVVIIILRCIQQWALSAEAGLLRYDLQSLGETLFFTLLQVGIILIAFINPSILILLIWMFISLVFSLIFHFFLLRTVIISKKITWKFSSKHAKELVQFGIVQWVSNLGSTLFSYADKIIVNLFGGPNIVGIYSAITSLTQKINELSALPLRVLPPNISSSKAILQKDKILLIYSKATRLNGVLVFGLSSFLIFWADRLAIFFVNKNIAEFSSMLQLAAIIYGIYSLNAASFYTAIGIGKPIINAKWTLSGGILFILLLIILAPSFGIVGAIWANAGYILTLTINYEVSKSLGIKLISYFKIFFPTIALLLSWLIFTYIFDWFMPETLLIQIFIFIILEIVFLLFIAGRDLTKEIIGIPIHYLKRVKIIK